MATGTILLPIGACVPSDGSAGNAAPAILRVQGTEASPKKHAIVAAFAPDTADEHVSWTFQMPADYASGGSLVLQWTSTSTTSGHEVVWAARVAATTPADTDTPVEHAHAAAATVTTGVNTTEAGRLISSTITLTTDSAAAGDLINLLLYRDQDAAADDATGDATLWSAALTYTTA